MCNGKSPIEYIFGRRSIRKYKEISVSDETTNIILSSAMSAPTACDKKSPEFIVLTDKSKLKDVSDFLPNGGFLADAPLGIIVCGNIKRAHTESLSYMLQDASAAIENILLAVSVLDLGACWLGVHPREDRIEKIKQYFNLPQEIIPVSVISIGYPAEEKEARKRFFNENVHFNSY
jgi:nitroreductase